MLSRRPSTLHCDVDRRSCLLQLSTKVEAMLLGLLIISFLPSNLQALTPNEGENMPFKKQFRRPYSSHSLSPTLTPHISTQKARLEVPFSLARPALHVPLILGRTCVVGQRSNCCFISEMLARGVGTECWRPGLPLLRCVMIGMAWPATMTGMCPTCESQEDSPSLCCVFCRFI
jgi:hypothetical protein